MFGEVGKVSELLFILALLLLFLAVGVSRSIYDGSKKPQKVTDPALKRRLWLSWLLVGAGGVVLLIALMLDR